MNLYVSEIRYPIALFSASHIVFMAVLMPLAAFLAYFFSKKIGFNKKLIWVCAFIGLLCEIERIVFYIEETAGGFRLPPNQIPLNACPFQVILIFILALSENPQKHRKLLSFMYPMMVGGGFIGFLLPGEALAFHGLTELSTYRYFFYHGMVIFLGFYLYFSKPFQYEMRDYGTGLFISFSTLILAVYLNGFFGWDETVNHMFVVRPPAEGLPILNFNRGWVFYILDMMWIGASLCTLCYLPVIIRSMRIKSNKSNKSNKSKEGKLI